MTERHSPVRFGTSNRRRADSPLRHLHRIQTPHQNGFGELLVHRHVLASCDGRYVAEVVRGVGSALGLIHSSVDLVDTAFDRVILVQVSAVSVVVWGQREGKYGVWKVTEHGVFFRTELPELTYLVRTPVGEVPVGPHGVGAQRYVVGRREIVVAEGTDLSFRENGQSFSIVPMSPFGEIRGLWLSFPNEAEYEDLPMETSGPPIWPMKFFANRVRRFPMGGHHGHLLSTKDGDVLWDGHETMSVTHDAHGSVVQFWTSFAQNVMALLILPDRNREGHRKLIVNNVTMVEGSFIIEPDGFQWSPDANHFVAQVVVQDTDGNSKEVRLISDVSKPVTEPCSVEKAQIDDHGRISYIVQEPHRGSRLVVDGKTVFVLPFIWNLSQTPTHVCANGFKDGSVHRIEIPFSR